MFFLKIILITFCLKGFSTPVFFESLYKEVKVEIFKKIEKENLKSIMLTSRENREIFIEEFFQLEKSSIDILIKENPKESTLWVKNKYIQKEIKNDENFNSITNQVINLKKKINKNFINIEKIKKVVINLPWAVRKNHIDIVNAILEKTPEISSIQDNDRMTALHLAVKKNYIDIVNAILKKTPEVSNIKDKLSFFTAFYKAIFCCF